MMVPLFSIYEPSASHHELIGSVPIRGTMRVTLVVMVEGLGPNPHLGSSEPTVTDGSQTDSGPSVRHPTRALQLQFRPHATDHDYQCGPHDACDWC